MQKYKVKRHRVSKKAKRFFFENIVLMLSSGVDVVSGLEALKMESKDKRLNALVDDMLQELYGGTPFWMVLQKFDIINDNMSKVIKVGEESGNLNNNMRIVLEQMRKDSEISAKLRSASLYPIIVFFVLIIVGLGVAIFILPRLTEVYTSLNVELPDITKTMIELGRFFDGNGKFYTLAGVVVFFILMFFIFKFSKTKWIGQNILFTFGPLKKLLSELEFARMGFLVNGLLASGFSLVDSFRILANTTSLHFYSSLYNRIASGIENGLSFTEIFNNDKNAKRLLPVYIRQAIGAAEKSSNLQITFKQISTTFESEHQTTVNNLSTAFEPALLLFVWIFVALLAIAVILPIYSLVGSFTDVQGTSSTTPTNTTTEVVTTTKDVNAVINVKVYVENSKVYDVIGGNVIFVATAGEQFKVIKFENLWYNIEFAPNQNGWISSSDVSEVK